MHEVHALKEPDVESALSSATSRAILRVCVQKARSVREITAESGLPIASVYRYVKRLMDSEILVIERSALTDDGKPYDLYRSRLKAGRIEFSVSGTKISWEHNLPIEDKLLHLWGNFGDQK